MMSEDKKHIIQKQSVLMLLSIFLLLIGGFTYLIFRPHTLVMFSWLKFINCESLFPQRTFNSDSKVIEFFIYSLPDGFWILSFLIAISLLWKRKRTCFYIYSTPYTLVSILFEVFQKYEIIPGTFDFADIVVLLIFHGIGILIYEFIILEVSYEKQKLD